MILSWRALPMVRIAGALAAGITAATLPAATPSLAWPLGVAVVAAGVLLAPVSLVQRGFVRGVAVLLLFAGFGLASMTLERSRLEAIPSEVGPYFVARLLEAPRGRSAWLGADAELLESWNGELRASARGTVKLMFAREAITSDGAAAFAKTDLAAPAALDRGSLIVSAAEVAPVRGPLNPDAFDYRRFLAARGVHAQAWLRDGDFRAVGPPAPPTRLARLRAYLGARIDAHYRDAREAGVARALLLGDKSGLDEATRLTYTATGAVHVLAVSGLHTGVVAAIVVWLLAAVLRGRWPWLQFGGLVLALVGYALLTGLSPSVLRASFMFAVVFAGRLLRLDGQPLNTLGAAAVMTLLVSPGSLFALGFQLSYLAVAGILLFYRSIARRLATGIKPVDWIGGAVAVSIAATVGTAPVTVFHFHQFPVYFALSTPVVFGVSLALPTLIAELALDAALQLFGVTWAYTFALSNALIYGCNVFLLALARLPNVLLDGLWPDGATVALLLVATVSAAVYLHRRSRPAAWAATALFAASGLTTLASNAGKLAYGEATVYALREGAVVDIFYGYNLRSARLGAVDEAQEQREAGPHRAALGRPIAEYGSLPSLAGDTAVARFYADGQVRWAELSAIDPPMVAGAPAVDWVLVHDASRLEPEEVIVAFPGADFLLADRPPPWLRAAWDSLGARAHILAEDGAYVRRL